MGVPGISPQQLVPNLGSQPESEPRSGGSRPTGSCRDQSEEQNRHWDRAPCLAIFFHPGKSMQITRVLKL